MSGPAIPPDAVRIEGVRPVIEALRAGRRRVWRVELPGSGASPGLRELRALVSERALASSPAREAVAWAEPFPEEPFEQLLISEPVDFIAALDQVTDVGNLGSIARSAETAGCRGLLLEQRNAPPIREGALRSSAGALEHLRVGRTPSLRRALELLKREGFTVMAAAAGGRPLSALTPERLRGRLVWVFGSEEHGLRSTVVAQADEVVGVGVHGRVESLSVTSAAAYLLHRTAEIRGVAAGGGHREM